MEIMAKKFVTGLVVGKFCPLHDGHIKVIETAAAQCENLIILSYTSGNFPGCEAEKRQEWLEQATKYSLEHDRVHSITIQVLDRQAEMLGVYDDSPEDVHREFCADYLLNKLGTTVDAVFTSEDYGQGFADYLSLYFTAKFLNPKSVKHVMVDKDRIEYPISGTQLRESVMYMDRFVPWYVRKDFVRKVLFLGAESTGKTTLVKALGDERHTALEFGRFMYDKREGKLRYEDMARIGKGQLEVENSRAAGLKMDEFLYCDTSPLTTRFYSEQWFGRVSDDLWDSVYKADCSYYKIFLCAPDFPMVQDGTRQDEKFRNKGHEFYLKELAGKEYTLLTGSLEERIATVKKELL
jgi:NadR type nicotinamide-nucleotide adenylyltransferase